MPVANLNATLQPITVSTCRCAHGGETYSCSAAHCPNQALCVGCVYSCAICQKDFCRAHLTDLSVSDKRYAPLYCQGCVALAGEGKAA